MPQRIALIVEDEAHLASIYAIPLRLVDYQVEIANDGQTALDRLADTPPDLVLLDLHLPDIQGQEILQHMKSTEALQSVKVVIVTADAVVADGLQDQCDFILIKPVDIFQLRELAEQFHPASTSQRKSRNR